MRDWKWLLEVKKGDLFLVVLIWLWRIINTSCVVLPQQDSFLWVQLCSLYSQKGGSFRFYFLHFTVLYTQDVVQISWNKSVLTSTSAIKKLLHICTKRFINYCNYLWPTSTHQFGIAICEGERKWAFSPAKHQNVLLKMITNHALRFMRSCLHWHFPVISTITWISLRRHSRNSNITFVMSTILSWYQHHGLDFSEWRCFSPHYLDNFPSIFAGIIDLGMAWVADSVKVWIRCLYPRVSHSRGRLLALAKVHRKSRF